MENGSTLWQIVVFIIILNIITASSQSATGCIEDLGVAGQYNLFLFGDLNQQFVDVDGKVAVQGSAVVEGYAVGSQLDASFKNDDTFIVQGASLNWTGGTLVMGNLLTSPTTAVHLNAVNLVNGLKRVGTFDFVAPRTFLQTKSQQFGALAKTGDPDVHFGVYTLNANKTGINVFQLTQSNIQEMNTLIMIGNPSLTGLIINVLGTNIQFGSFGMSLNGIQSNQILWNYEDATSITVTSGIQIEGSTLALKAAVTGRNGNYKGSLIAKSLGGDNRGSQFHGILCLLCFSSNPRPCIPTSTQSSTVTATASSSTITPTPTSSSSTSTVTITATSSTSTATLTSTSSSITTSTITPTPTRTRTQFRSRSRTPTPTATQTPTKNHCYRSRDGRSRCY